MTCNKVSFNYLKRRLVAFHRSHHQDVSSFNGRFGPSIDDLQKWTSGVDQIPLGTGGLLRSFLLHHIHRDAFSACTPVSFMIFFLSLPVMPSIPRVLHTDCAGKPRHPTSTGKHHAFHPFAWHCSTNSWYLSRLRSCASSIRSSCGTVSSISSTVFSVCDHNTISGRKFVVAICCGKLSCLLTSARICQSLLVARMPPAAVFTCFPRFPSVSQTKLMNWGPFP